MFLIIAPYCEWTCSHYIQCNSVTRKIYSDIFLVYKIFVMESSDIESDTNEVKFWFSKRFYVAVLMFFGTINTFSLSANMNIAIVEMTSQKNVTINNETITYGPEFEWDSRIKGLILGAFSYGISLSIFGGYLAMKFGGSRIISLGVATTAVITLLNPLMIRHNFHLFLAARAIEGIVEGFAIVSFAELWAQWAPVQDRSRLMSIGFSGMYAGTAIAYPICGYVMHHYGWPAAFYLTGGVSLIWSAIWFLVVPSDPSRDRFISKKELRYIKNNQMQRERPKNIRSLFFSLIRSKCVLALCVAKFTYGVGFSIVVTCFPMYIKDLTNEEIHKVGIYSSLPNVISAFTVPVVGCMADYLHNKDILSVTKIHKLFMCAGFVIGALLLFIIGSFSATFAVSMICFMLFKIALSTNYVISQLCCVSMAPKCSGVVFGFLTIFYTLSSVSSPLFIGLVVTDHSQAQWNTCFLMSAALLLIGGLTYFFFGSSDPQPWSYSGVEDDRKSDMSDENKEF